MRPIALLLLPLLVTACRSEPATPTTATPTTATPSTDTASAATPPSSDAWTVRADGAGPLRIGMTSAEASAAAGQRVVPDTTDFGAQCAYTSVRTGAGDTLAVMFSDDRIVRVEPGFEEAIRSADGFGVGTTEAQVRAKYPNLRAEGHAYVPGGKYLVTHPLPDTTLKIVYETDEKGVVTDLRGGRDPFVGYVEGCA